ncbi:hypothetical protein LUZ60_004455 [Juncus effusus]|nr:hypothetical protein LUZ60_004455 [Juncus effusus]
MATSKPFSLLLCMLAFLSVSSSFQAQAAKSDFFYLTLMWPGSHCDNWWSSCCMPTTGKPALDFFVESMETYDSYTGKMVTNCASTCTFYVNQLKNFIDDMYAYWPDVNCPNNNGVSMWKSTFCTYGTCSNLTQQQYFQRALALRKDLDILTLLANKGIVPADAKTYYNLEDIESALRAKYPFSFVVECSKRSDFNHTVDLRGYQLYKIRYCISMDGTKFITCPITKESNCRKQVLFEKFTYNDLETVESGINPIEMPTNRDETI